MTEIGFISTAASSLGPFIQRPCPQSFFPHILSITSTKFDGRDRSINQRFRILPLSCINISHLVPVFLIRRQYHALLILRGPIMIVTATQQISLSSFTRLLPQEIILPLSTGHMLARPCIRVCSSPPVHLHSTLWLAGGIVFAGRSSDA